MPISRTQLPKEIDGKLRGARGAKRGLWANINRRKKLGISRPKSKSTISKKAYANMEAGFPKKHLVVKKISLNKEKQYLIINKVALLKVVEL
jgi:hypothetical protein